MYEDTRLLEQIRNFFRNKPDSTAKDVVDHFKLIGIEETKVLYILREIFG